MEPLKRDLSMVRFFNSYDLSDCTLEIIEGDAEETNDVKCGTVDRATIKTEYCDDCNSPEAVSFIKGEEGRSCFINSHKRQKMDCLFTTKKEDNSDSREKKVLYIHSLLFCSNSEYFQKLLMTNSRQQNLRMFLKTGETDHFIKLIKLFYDDSQITSMTLIDTVQVLKFAKRFSCLNLTSKLLGHISSCRICSIRTLNLSVRIYYDLLESESENMQEVIIRIKSSCMKYAKRIFCPFEKVFGPLLNDFLKISFDTLYFLLDNIDAGIAVTEDNIIALVMHWIVASESDTMEKKSSYATKLLDKCYTEHASTTFVMNVLSQPHKIISQCSNYKEFYIKSLEKYVKPYPSPWFPDYRNRMKRTRNFAFDHEVLLYFAPVDIETKSGNLVNPLIKLSTQHKNIIFVRGYEVSLSAGVFGTKDDKELRVKFTILNLNRIPHSRLYFSMMYAVNSPSVSEYFSPWNHCSVMIDSNVTNGWVMVSLIAEHSLIRETGFYLKFYIE